MITVTDAQNIVYKHAEQLGLPVYQFGNIPKGEVKKSRVTVRAKDLTEQTIWNPCFIEVNVCVPDKKDEADSKMLNNYDRLAHKAFLEIVDRYDGSTYRIRWQSSHEESDASLRCHYINIRLKFEILNVL